MKPLTNAFHLEGEITHIHAPVYFKESDDSMVLIEIKTTGDEGVFTHRVSMINELMEDFFHKFDVGCHIYVEGCLRPRPMKASEPNGDVFFELRCLQFHKVNPLITNNIGGLAHGNFNGADCADSISVGQSNIVDGAKEIHIIAGDSHASNSKDSSIIHFPLNKEEATAVTPQGSIEQSQIWGFPPSIPVASKSLLKSNEHREEAWIGGDSDYNGILVEGINFLNGAPIDLDLPFFMIEK